jgi:hypothetical protein
MNSNIKYIIIGIIILIISFFIGRWTSPTETKIVKVTIPESSGKSPIIINPKPLIQFKDSLVYKDSLIVTENPFNKELADKYINLESETERLKEYIKSIEVRKYKVPFENDTIKIVGDVEVQGELKSLKYNWFIKQRNIDIPIEIKKPTMNLLLGGSVSNTVQLDKFNINANLGIQRKNGDLILTSYGIFDKSIQVGYLINLKL